MTLTWWISRRLDLARLPAGRVVVEFDYGGSSPTRIWLVLDRGAPSVCTNHPGFDTDVRIATEPVAFMRVFSGIVELRTARAAGDVEITGDPRLIRQLPQWFLWSPFAPAVRAHLAV